MDGGGGVTLEDLIGYNLEKTARLLRRELAKRFRDQGLAVTPWQWILLYRLWEEEGLTQAELAERTVMDGPAVTRMIDVLERQRLVVRERCKDDRRKTRLCLTEQGSGLMPKLVSIVATHHASATRSISAKEVAALKRILKKVFRAFKMELK